MPHLIRRAFSTFSRANAIAGPSSRHPPPKPRLGVDGLPPHPLPTSSISPSARSSRLTSPIDVRRRRRIYPAPARDSLSPLTDPAFHEDHDTPKRLPVQLEAEFRRVRDQLLFLGPEGAARADFLRAAAMWRSRVRGTRIFENADKDGMLHEEGIFATPEVPSKDRTKYLFFKEVDDRTKPYRIDVEGQGFDFNVQDMDVTTSASRVKLKEGERVVGQRIYLPNVLIRLVRNYWAPNQPYDPWVATFRMPIGMTRTDLRSYLKAVYDLDITFIRTILYRGKIVRNKKGQLHRQKGSRYNFKRVVVGLYEPFHYPDDVVELKAQGVLSGVGDRWAVARNEAIEKSYGVVYRQLTTRKPVPVQTLKEQKLKRLQPRDDRQGVAVRKIVKKKTEREKTIREAVDKLREQGKGAVIRGSRPMAVGAEA